MLLRLPNSSKQLLMVSVLTVTSRLRRVFCMKMDGWTVSLNFYQLDVEMSFIEQSDIFSDDAEQVVGGCLMNLRLDG